MKFLINDEKDIFLMSKKIMNGHNPNEVMLVKKLVKMRVFLKNFLIFLDKAVFSSNICCF